MGASLIVCGIFFWLVAVFFTVLPKAEKTIWLEVLIYVLIVAGAVFMAHGGMLLSSQ